MATAARKKKATDDLKERFQEIAADSEAQKKKLLENESEAEALARKELEAELAYKAEKKRLKTEKRK